MYRYTKARFGQFMGVTALLIAFTAMAGVISIIKQRLIDAGYDRDAVQAKVNEIYQRPARITYTVVAFAGMFSEYR